MADLATMQGFETPWPESDMDLPPPGETKVRNKLK